MYVSIIVVARAACVAVWPYDPCLLQPPGRGPSCGSQGGRGGLRGSNVVAPPMGGRTPFALLIYLTPPPPQLALPWGRAHTSLPHRYSRSPPTTHAPTHGLHRLDDGTPATSASHYNGVQTTRYEVGYYVSTAAVSDYVQPAGLSPRSPASEGGPTPTSFSMALLHLSLPQCDSVWPSSRVTVAAAAEGRWALPGVCRVSGAWPRVAPPRCMFSLLRLTWFCSVSCPTM
ncbi:hypothetical protein GWK47_034545 [Chionoecetes opilio]|uniref:Uncharacterized protein n=1 Tax=Chionoecetes opilio TaxID=41210 RepID=A0A8J4YNX7_CHIOP|nr:hypothetical protein GWK47_034545 [Chionoecetes opilio]